MQRSARFTLIALILVCTLPVVASYATYHFWQPDDTMNYGELIPPTPLPDVRAEGIGGADVDQASLRGRWTMVYAGAGECDTRCTQALYAMRQSWLAQGEEMRRVERLWLVTGSAQPASAALEDQRGLKVVRAAEPWMAGLPGSASEEHVYLVDPLGNVMMRFPPEPDVKRMIKDMQRLLKYSRLG